MKGLCDPVLNGLPHAHPGQRIGLLGGSFDPPHAGHLHITETALRSFGIDRVWWLVSPGNPLKADAPADMERRVAAARALVQDRRVLVSDLEARLGTRYTADTLGRLRRLYPRQRFVWLMGADNLADLHRWEDWDWIMRNIPVGVLARPGAQLRAALSPAAQTFRLYRLAAHNVGALAQRTAPVWALKTGPMVDESSTRLRKIGAWVR